MQFSAWPSPTLNIRGFYGEKNVYLYLSLWIQSEKSEVKVLVAQSCLCDPMDYSPSDSCPWDFPGKNTRMGCHFLLQGIFPTQGSNLRLLHGRWILYRLSHQGSTVSCLYLGKSLCLHWFFFLFTFKKTYLSICMSQYLRQRSDGVWGSVLYTSCSRKPSCHRNTCWHAVWTGWCVLLPFNGNLV